MTMSIMAAPLAVLYLASIGLCSLIEKIKSRRSQSELSYDADGTGAIAGILFAILDTGLGLTYSDFRVV